MAESELSIPFVEDYPGGKVIHFGLYLVPLTHATPEELFRVGLRRNSDGEIQLVPNAELMDRGLYRTEHGTVKPTSPDLDLKPEHERTAVPLYRRPSIVGTTTSRFSMDRLPISNTPKENPNAQTS